MLIIAFSFVPGAVAEGDLDNDGILDSIDEETILDGSYTLEAGEYTFQDLKILNGAVLTLQSNPLLPDFKGVTITANNITIEPGGSISADKTGYAPNEGPGAGIRAKDVSNWYGGGGGYGGNGGTWSIGLGGRYYGSAIVPLDLGSGGGGQYPMCSGYGGGAIQLKVTDTLGLDGIITASGGGDSSAGAGGSGGSIYIDAHHLTGSGSITANGGDGYTASGHRYASGGGGRIAVFSDSSSFTGLANAIGGQKYVKGENGTVVFVDTSQNILTTGHAFRFEQTDVELYGPYQYDTFILKDSTITTDGNVTISGNHVNIENSSFVLGGWTSTLSSNDLQIQDSSVSLLDSCAINIQNPVRPINSLITFSGAQFFTSPDLILEDSTVTFAGGEPLDVENLILTDNSVITTLQLTKINLTLINLEIDSTSSISADMKGHAPNEGPGAGVRAKDVYNWYGGGGGYGGKGGTYSIGIGGAYYGSSIKPFDFGSGGGGQFPMSSGYGGGALQIKVTDTLTLDGIITANGGGDSDSGAGGSGGSILIDTENFVGSGSITANGGNGYSRSGHRYASGGGGRIAVYYQNLLFNGNVNALGGQRIANGENGTVAFIDKSQNILSAGHSFRFEQTDVESIGPYEYDTVFLKDSTITTDGNVTISGNHVNIENTSFTLGGQTSTLSSNDLQIQDSTIVILDIDAIDVNQEIIIQNSTIGGNNTTITSQLVSFEDAEISLTGESSLKAMHIDPFLRSKFVLENTTQFTSDGSIEIIDSSVAFLGEQVVTVPELTLCKSSLTLSGEETFLVQKITLQDNSHVSVLTKKPLHLSLDGLVVDSSSSISADSQGYSENEGPGAIAGTGCGGSYGGRGGGQSAPTYGSNKTPTDFGSGGGTTFTLENAGKGGGAIQIFTKKTLQVDGLISANGEDAISTNGANGGGSGGSIYLVTKSFSGNGIIRANGGQGDTVSLGGIGGSGGGGRIAVYSKDSTYSGSFSVEGGTTGYPGEKGTICISQDATEMPLTFIAQPEIQGSQDSVYETLLHSSGALSGNGEGDVSGTLIDFSFDMVTVDSGLNAGMGFTRGSCAIEFDDTISYATFQGMVYPDSSNIRMKGVLSGEMEGTVDILISNSTPDINILDRCQAHWYFNKVMNLPVSAEMDSEGDAIIEQIQKYPNTEIFMIQSALKATAGGYYEGPLDVVLTHSHIQDRFSPWYGEGFSFLSYHTNGNYGFGWSYDNLKSENQIILSGQFDGPLTGRFSGFIDNRQSPRIVSFEIFRLNIEKPPSSDLDVIIWGPLTASPGQTITYFSEVRNDGILAAENVSAFIKTDPRFQFKSCGCNCNFQPPRSPGFAAYELIPILNPNSNQINPLVVGIPSGSTQVGNNFDLGGLIAEGVGEALIPEEPYCGDGQCSCWRGEQFWCFEDCWRGECIYDPPDDDFKPRLPLGNWDDIPGGLGPFEWEFCPEIHEQVVINSPPQAGSPCNNPGQYLFDYTITIYEQYPLTTEIKNLCNGTCEATKWCRNIKWDLKYICKTNCNCIGETCSWYGESCEPVEISLPKITDKSETEIYYCDPICPVCEAECNESVPFTTEIVTPKDPNVKYGPEGRVNAGETLDYRIEFENIGEGIAFGVYFTDTLDLNLDDKTLVVGSVYDADSHVLIAPPGEYNPNTRTITWLAGEVGPYRGGYANISINVRDDVPYDTEIINYGIVYFPSVAEITRTNGILSIVGYNKPPSLRYISDRVVNTSESLEIQLNASDPDGDEVTFTGTQSDGTVLPDGVEFDANSGLFHWVPHYSQAGNYSIQFGAHDWRSSDFKNVTILVATNNRPPILDSIGNYIITAGEKLEFSITATDPDGDILTFSAEPLPAGATFDALTHVFSWTPDQSQSGETEIAFFVTDGLASDSETITITVQQVSDPSEQLQSLKAYIEGLNLQKGTANSLLKKVENAIKSLEKGNIQAAKGQLNAFINEVNAQSGKKIPSDIADTLKEKVQGIIQSIF